MPEWAIDQLKDAGIGVLVFFVLWREIRMLARSVDTLAERFDEHIDRWRGTPHES